MRVEAYNREAPARRKEAARAKAAAREHRASAKAAARASAKAKAKAAARASAGEARDRASAKARAAAVEAIGGGRQSRRHGRRQGLRLWRQRRLRRRHLKTAGLRHWRGSSYTSYATVLWLMGPPGAALPSARAHGLARSQRYSWKCYVRDTYTTTVAGLTATILMTLTRITTLL